MYISIFSTFLVTIFELNKAHTTPITDICNTSRNAIYTPAGFRSIITAREVTPWANISECHLELISCSSCVLLVKIWLVDLSNEFENKDPKSEHEDRACNGDRIEITEPLQRVHSRKLFCSIKNGSKTISKFIYRSHTKGIKITFYYSKYYDHPFTMEYIVKYNIRNYEIPPHDVELFEGTITSPFFPIHYPSDYRAQYNIKCSPKILRKCQVKIFFLDYQLASQSLLEFFESKTKRIGITTGRIFRPPIMISSGRLLSVNFYANKASSFGFKVNYSAILGEENAFALKPETSCGGYIEDVGGVIVMSKMTNELNTVTYDCVWIIRPQHGHKHLKTHLYVKIISFANMVYKSKLEVHKGLTSGHRTVQRVASSHDLLNLTEISKEHVVSLNTGFYIYLHGIFNSRSRLAISYSAFSFSHSHEMDNFMKSTQFPALTQDCYLAGDFLCYNHRCISGHLHCDGFDHCGDNSDEIYQCARVKEDNDYWYQQNYYFPKTESFSVMPTGFIFAFFTAFVTFLLCSFICTLLYRTQHQNELNNTLGTLNQMLAEQRPRGRNNSDEIANIEEPPPRYESPPHYQDVMEMETLVRNQIKRYKAAKFPFNRALFHKPNDDANACCSDSLIVSRGRNSIPHSSSDDDSCNYDEISFKQYAIFKNRHSSTYNSTDSITSTDSFIGKRNYRHNSIRKKRKIRTSTVKNNLKLLLSKSTSNLIPENSTPFYGLRLSRSVDGLFLKPKSKNFNICTYKKLVNK